MDRDAIVKALESGQLAGYAGDVWYPQPASANHPWRTMPHEGMTPHTSGSTLSAQARYSAGTREILECFYSGRPIREEYLIAQGGHLAGNRLKSNGTKSRIAECISAKLLWKNSVEQWSPGRLKKMVSLAVWVRSAIHPARLDRASLRRLSVSRGRGSSALALRQGFAGRCSGAQLPGGCCIWAPAG